MKEPRLLGDIMKEYLRTSDDDFAVAFRHLAQEHGSNFLTPENEEEVRDDK